MTCICCCHANWAGPMWLTLHLLQQLLPVLPGRSPPQPYPLKLFHIYSESHAFWFSLSQERCFFSGWLWEFKKLLHIRPRWTEACPSHSSLSTQNSRTAALLSPSARGVGSPPTCRGLGRWPDIKDLVNTYSNCYSSPWLELPVFKGVSILQIHKLALGLLSQPH